MRSLISLIILAPFLFYFAFQPQMDEVNNAKAMRVEDTVHTALEEAKIKGYFTSSDLNVIAQSLSTSLGYPPGDVTVSGTTTPQTRGEYITLQVSIPARLNFMNLFGGNNRVMITRSYTEMSDKLQ